MDTCCDTCGHIGISEAILTCCQCKIISRHMYCMKIYRVKLVTDWLCEECSLSKPSSPCVFEESTDVPKVNSPEVLKGGELPTEKKRHWEKFVATGKTRYISVNEVIKLSSGENKLVPSPSKSGMSKFGAANRRKTVPLNFSSHQNFPSGAYQPPKPQRPDNVENRKDQIQLSKEHWELRSRSSLQPSEAPKGTPCVKEQPSEAQLHATRRSVKQPSLPSANTSLVAISGGDGHNDAINLRTSGSGAENMSKNLLLDPEKYKVPASDALWKGSFKVQDYHVQKEMNHLVQAHPPSRVRKKTYEFSKQMPKVLQFKLVPSRPLLNNLFDCIPDKRDIALYFFPGDGERSEEDYVFLVEHMISTNYALREQIADVELLVFSSQLLPDDCQCWDGRYFLWGIFHRIKQHAMQLKAMVHPSEDLNRDQNQMHEGEEVDMDVDMIGGIPVGRIDVPIQKEPFTVEYKEEESKPALALPEPALKTASSQTLAARIPPVSVKTEPPDLIPPGFEEVYRMRIQSSLSSTYNNGIITGQNGL